MTLMAGIFKKLGGNVRGRNLQKELYLEFIRFRKFLENMRAVIDLIEDAKNKLREEYIFDRHYVLSLVDGVLEEVSMLAFNASVLAPAAGKEIYRQVDAYKKFAQEEFLERRSVYWEKFFVPSSSRDADPEIQLLSAVLNWFAGPLPQDQPSVMDFIRYVTDRVLRNCRKVELIKKAGASVGNVKLGELSSLKLVDVGGISSPDSELSVSHRDINCRPFGLLFIGSLEGTASGGIYREESGMDRWMLFDEESISLRLSGENVKIHLEATLYGNVASDFIFLYSQNPIPLGSDILRGFWVEKTGQGTIAWIYDVSTDRLEKQLIQLGSMLL